MSAGRYAWMDAALCAQADPDRWSDPSKGSSGQQTKRICGRCPVRPQCEAHAAALEGEFGAMSGVWGGASQKQRRQQRQQLGEAA